MLARTALCYPRKHTKGAFGGFTLAGLLSAQSSGTPFPFDVFLESQPAKDVPFFLSALGKYVLMCANAMDVFLASLKCQEWLTCCKMFELLLLEMCILL